MVNESDDRYENQEDGEYHFSDEHGAYEVETETPRAGAAVAAIKTSPFDKLGKFKRIGIATVVFFVLMFVVYKFVSPSGLSTPNTDITQASATPPVTKPAVVAQLKAPTVTQQAPAPTTSITTQPVVAVQSQPAQQSVQAMQPMQQPAQVQQQSQPQGQSAAPTMMMPASSVPMGASETPNKEVVERIAAVEQQNSKLANVLQIEYAQRMTDYENQSTATQAKLRELNTRVANIEASLNQITQLLQGGTNKSIQVSPSASSSGLPAAKSADPKQSYTVQAIIPGRAWLKSDTGDTVTVAEGDVLRDYGRIAKIDPYDGVVEIDTGSKVVSLSYGSGND